MNRRFNSFALMFITSLILLITLSACDQQSPPASNEMANDLTQESEVAVTPSAESADATAPLTSAESTADAALQIAVATQQATIGEGMVQAAGGAAPSDGVQPTAATQGPAIVVEPMEGTAGTVVTVAATGYPANSQVDLYLAGLVRASSGGERPNVYASATTDASGNATLSFAMPATWPSGDPILTGDLVVLVATADFAARASGTFAYTPPTVPTPTNTTPPTPIPTATNTSTPLPIPTPTPTNRPTPAQNPFVDVEPLAGSGGTKVTLHGGGFPAGANVNIFLGTFDAQIGGGDGSNNVRYAAVTSDANGYFTVAFNMPSRWPDGSEVAPGLLLILAETNNFAQQASAVFDYQQPEPTPTVNPYAQIDPPAGSAGTEITIRGGGFPGNTQLDLYIAGIVASEVGAAARPNSYASAMTNGEGDFQMSFTMPGNWPDGRAIESGRLGMLVATQDYRVRASVTFDYVVPTPTPQPTVPPTATTVPTATPINPAYWEGRYYDNTDLSGDPVLVRGDTELRFNWGNAAPAPSVPNDNFSVRWQRTATFEQAIYRFTVEADDGFRLYIDNTLILESWRMGSARTLEFDYPLEAGDHVVKLEYFEDRGLALVNLRWEAIDFGWYGTFYNSRDLGSDPVVQRYDDAIDFDWGSGSPAAGVNADGFSARWLRRVLLDGGVYRFSARADEGVRVWVNDELILDGWQGSTTDVLFTSEVHLGGGEYLIRVDYQENLGNAHLQMSYAPVVANAPQPTATPDAVVGRILFDSDPRNNRRGVNATFCSGFESECEFGNCPENYRLLWGPFCRETDYSYIKPGLYRVSIQGGGRVRAGATDYGQTNQLFGFAEEILQLPGEFTFCWPGRGENGYGFETVVQSTGDQAAITRVTVAYLGESCP